MNQPRFSSNQHLKQAPEDYRYLFTWPVDAAGYGWRDCAPVQFNRGEHMEKERPPFLVSKQDGQGGPIRQYHPLHDYPGLHKELAGLTAETILPFADKHGMLGIGGHIYVQGEASLVRLDEVESFRQWLEEISTMERLVTLFDNLENLDYLKKRVFWRDDHVGFFDGSNEDLEAFRRAEGYRKSGEEHLIKRFVKGSEMLPQRASTIAELGYRHDRAFRDWKTQKSYPASDRAYKGAASVFFCMEMNEQLRRHELFGYLLAQPGDMGNWGGRSGHLRPKTLLGAMYLQLYFRATGQVVLKICPHCKRDFPVEGRPAGRQKDYCSKQCQKNTYYHRVKKARRLHAEGLSVKKIACELGSTEKTVRGWIRQGDGDGIHRQEVS